MKTDSANVFNTLSQAQTFRDKFRKDDVIAKVGKKLVIVTREQARRLELKLVVEPTSDDGNKHYTSLAKWRSDAKKAGCRVRLITRWAAGGGHHTAVHPVRGIVGFYNFGTMNGRKLNGGHLTLATLATK